MKHKIIWKNIFRKFQLKHIFGVGVFLFMSPLLFAQTSAGKMDGQLKKKNPIKGITIHQEVTFRVSPHQLYETLLSSKEFSACTKRSFSVFSDTSAFIDSAEGGIFSVFDGHIIGRILETVPDKRIVEAWRVVDWPAGIYSIVEFEFRQINTGSLLVFNHVGFPEGLKEHLTLGWQQHYWDALVKYFQ